MRAVSPTCRCYTTGFPTLLLNLPTKQALRRGLTRICSSHKDMSVTIDQALRSTPTKTKIISSACLAFVISNMDKVNLSIAIIPMAQEFGWTPGSAGLIQSSFFLGFLVAQLPGGYFASRLGGRRILPIGLATWSLATFLAPWMSSTIPTLAVSRAMVGLGEAVAPTSVVDMIARCVPKEERSSAVSLAFTGLHIGSIVGLLASPALIQAAGWRSLFIIFGATGLIWYLGFEALMAEVQRDDPETAAKLTAPMKSSLNSVDQPDIPFRAFIRDPAVQALCFTHFVNNWFHFTMLAWLPSYFTDTLKLADLSHAAHTSLVPPLAGIVCSLVAGPTADWLIKAGWTVPTVRKIMQNIALLGPAACLAAVSFSDSSSTDLVVPFITAALGLSSFSLAGLYCTHGDMSPKYAGALLGLTNTSGAMAGIIGVSAVGMLLDATGSWDTALFFPSIILLAFGSLSFTLQGRNEPIDFDIMDNSPLEVEKWLEGPRKGAVALASAAVHAIEEALPAPPQPVVEAARQARRAAQRAAQRVASATDALIHPNSLVEQDQTPNPSTLFQQSNAIQGGYFRPTFGGSMASVSSFSDMVTSSLSGAYGDGGRKSPMLVSAWTVASVMPDFDLDSSLDDEIQEAEEEVEKIIEDLRRKQDIPKDS